MRSIFAGLGGGHFVRWKITGFGLYGDIFGFTPHAQLVDVAAFVLVVNALNALVVAVVAAGGSLCRRWLGAVRLDSRCLGTGQATQEQAGKKK